MLTREYITELTEKYADAVLRLSYTYLKNMADAEDVVQDVFLRIMDKQPEFNDEKHEKAYIMKTAVNMCKNKIGLFWNKNRCSIDTVKEAEAPEKDSNESVRKAVFSLPAKYRIAVHMYYYEGYKTADIARTTGRTETAVRSVLMRARNKLKEMLKEEYDFEQEI